MNKAAWVMAALVLAGAGCDDDTTGNGVDMMAPSDLAVPDLAVAATATRGEELVKHLLLCGSCHTTPDALGNPSTDPAAFLAGGKQFTVNAGGDAGTITVYAPNLTPDNATGLGTWSNQQIVDAITVGVDDQGMPLWPTMPYQRFANLTPDDAASIALYLKSLTPQSHTVTEDTGHPALASTAFDFSVLPHTTLMATDSNYAAAERGRYLANLGCVTCHTPPGTTIGLDLTKVYAGGRSFGAGLKSSNLTPDNATGLGTWSAADIVATLKTNQEKGTGVMLYAPMAGGPDGFGGLTDGDLNDLAQFIHTLPPISNGPFMHPDM